LPSPAGGEGYLISPPLTGGDEGEGDLYGFTNDLISIIWLFRELYGENSPFVKGGLRGIFLNIWELYVSTRN